MTEQDIHLRDYLRVVKKRRGLITTFFAIVFVVVLLGTFSATPQYEGTAQVMIEKVQSGALTEGYRYSSYDPEFYETQYALIQSQAVALRVVKILSLEDKAGGLYGLEEEEAGLLTNVKDWLRQVKSVVSKTLSPGRPSSEGESSERSKADLIAAALREGIKVSPVKNTRIVAISYLSRNPEFAALVANSFARAYTDETLEMKMEATRRTLEWMAGKAEEERRKLEKTERSVQDYMKSHDIVTLENRVTVIPQKLSELGTELVRAESKRKELEALFNKASKAAGNPEAAESVVAGFANNALPTLRGQVLKAEQYIMELSGKFGPKHPTMIKAVADLDILKKKKEQEVSRIIQSIKSQYELARLKEDNLRGQVERTRSEALQLNEKLIQYTSLQRDVDTNSKLYDALMLKMKDRSVTGDTQPVNLWVVEKARAPSYPVKPRKAVNILLGIVVGLFGGIGLAFFVEYLDNTVKSPEETETALGAPVLATVPLAKAGEEDIEQALLKDPMSALAESFRALRTSVLLSSADSPPKKILVTSAAPGDGKTTVALNLALALAQSDKRVLVIGCDLRRPRLHKVFKFENRTGLSTYLAGAAEGDMRREGPIPNLTLMPSGPTPPNPSELLSSRRMEKLLDELAPQYDHILLDSPPVLSVADSLSLSRLCDGTMMVLRGHQTTYESAGIVLKSLQNINAHILGLVINRLDMKKSDYYYNEYYAEYVAEEG